MTFRNYLQQKGYSAATICTYEKYLQVFIDWLEAEPLHPDAVAYAELLDCMRWLQTKGCSRGAVKEVLGVLRHFFDWRIAAGVGGHNPAAGVYIKGIPRRRACWKWTPCRRCTVIIVSSTALRCADG